MKKVLLLILDGWGIGKQDASDGIYLAKTPFVDGLKNGPHSELKTYGEHVGLPDGQMGNSEVGHMNIGAGRVVYQMLARINKAFDEGSVESLPAMKELISQAKASKAKIHLMGLVSDGGVHSSLDHLLSLTHILKEEGLDDRVFIHAFMDGRDTDPNGGLDYLQKIENADAFGKTKVATIIGRYFAMDRDQRWERTAKAYNLLVNAEGKKFNSSSEALEVSYASGVTDEFVEPILLTEEGKIEEGDVVMCFNFRTDRGRQISAVLSQEDMPEFSTKSLNISYFTMTEYDKTFEKVSVIFKNEDLENTLGEVLANAGKTQLRAAETEKYPHVTFFFNGGREEPFQNEQRLMAASPKVATYDLQPEMSIHELLDGVCSIVKKDMPDFVCVNFANPDMVGHTGVPEAIIKACEVVDKCSEALVKACSDLGYSCLVIADHGNADKLMNADGSPHTAHTTNPVPCYLVSKDEYELSNGKLGDIAPTILALLGLDRPKEMDGQILIK